MTCPTLIDLNSDLIELNYYPFMIGLNNCNGSCNIINDLCTELCVSSKTIDINVKIFNMITKINDVKKMVKHNIK